MAGGSGHPPSIIHQVPGKHKHTGGSLSSLHLVPLGCQRPQTALPFCPHILLILPDPDHFALAGQLTNPSTRPACIPTWTSSCPSCYHLVILLLSLFPAFPLSASFYSDRSSVYYGVRRLSLDLTTITTQRWSHIRIRYQRSILSVRQPTPTF